MVKYDKPPKKLAKNKTVEPNLNTTDKIIATLVDLTNEDFQHLSEFSLLPIRDGSISNSKGFHFLNISSFKKFKKHVQKKAGVQKAVILRFQNQKKFVSLAQPDYRFTAYGQTFYGIKTPDKSWDILATDSDQFIKAKAVEPWKHSEKRVFD